MPATDAQSANLTPPIANPLQVEIVEGDPHPPVPLGPPPELQAMSLAPTTTSEQDLRTAGQRSINLLWETTQRNIALFIISITSLIAAFIVVRGMMVESTSDGLVVAAFTLLSSLCSLVVGFYFGRTNHARIGDDPRTQNRNGPLDDR